MHWTQVAYIMALCAALYGGGAPLKVVTVMVGNLVVTLAFSGTPLAVGVIDLLCAAMLIGNNMRANIVAVLFAMMVPVYVAGLKTSTTYTIVDVLAYLQLGVIWRVDSGLRNARRLVSRYGSRPFSSVVQRGHAERSVAMVSQKDKRLTCGKR